MTQPDKPSPPGEIHVHHLFGFALGMVAGANATRRILTSEKTPAFEDLPQGYAIAGTKLDTLAGDALLESNSQWFLLELKRSFASLRDELAKDRVRSFRDVAIASWTDEFWGPLLIKARSAHQFLYLCRVPNANVPELATLGYLDWLVLANDERGTKALWDSLRTPFTSFLASAGGTTRGFTLEEMATYVHLVNHTDSSTGISAEDARARIAIAVDEAGLATAVLYDDLRRELEQNHMRQQSHGRPDSEYAIDRT